MSAISCYLLRIVSDTQPLSLCFIKKSRFFQIIPPDTSDPNTKEVSLETSLQFAFVLNIDDNHNIPQPQLKLQEKG